MCGIVVATIALRKGRARRAAPGALTALAATAHSRRVMSDDRHPGAAALDQLQTTLEAALTLVRELADDGLLGRLIATFRAMPTPDRPVIIGVLEREVTGRLLSRATERAVGQATYPNPNARLYIRAHESTIDPRAFGRDEMMLADIRGMRIASLIRNVPELYATWKEALREAMEHVDESTRLVAEELLHDVLAAIAAAREETERPSDAHPADPPPDVPPDADERNRKP